MVAMSAAPPAAPDDPPVKPAEPPWRDFARSPLVPVALAATCGLVADRSAGVPFAAGMAVGVVGLIVWLIAQSRSAASGPVWLWVTAAGLAAAHHHAHRHSFGPDDIATFASERPNP